MVLLCSMTLRSTPYRVQYQALRTLCTFFHGTWLELVDCVSAFSPLSAHPEPRPRSQSLSSSSSSSTLATTRRVIVIRAYQQYFVLPNYNPRLRTNIHTPTGSSPPSIDPLTGSPVHSISHPPRPLPPNSHTAYRPSPLSSSRSAIPHPYPAVPNRLYTDFLYSRAYSRSIVA